MIAPYRGTLEGDQRLAELAQSQRDFGAFRQATATLHQIQSGEVYDVAAQQHQQSVSGYADFPGGRGGGIQADFDPLMELIQRTIEPESWESEPFAFEPGESELFASDVVDREVRVVVRAPPEVSDVDSAGAVSTVSASGAVERD